MTGLIIFFIIAAIFSCLTVDAAVITDHHSSPSVSVTSNWSNSTAGAKKKDINSERFLWIYNKLKDPANGYFDKNGIPYHCPETLMVEAPDYGHEV
jgi:hypothetical protein